MAQPPDLAEHLHAEPAAHLDATPARQGMRGVHVLWVLIVSFLLAAAALLFAWSYRWGDLSRAEPTNHVNRAEAQTFQ